MGVKNNALEDLINTTIQDLPKGGTYEIMWDDPRYEFVNIYAKHRRGIAGGPSITRRVMLDNHNAAGYRELYQTDKTTVDQNLKPITVPWCQIGTNYSWDVVELLRNKSSDRAFINLINERKAERLWGFADLLERRGWMTPTSASDDLFPYGIPYYVNYLDNGSTTAGFNGKTIRFENGSTGTVCASLDANTNPKWRNYADTYSIVDNTLPRKFRKALRQTNFTGAPNVPHPSKDGRNMAMSYFYCNEDTMTELEDFVESRDDNTKPVDMLGSVKVQDEGSITINRIMVKYVPSLDRASVIDGTGAAFAPNPIYFVDWSRIQPIVQDNYWMHQSEAMSDRSQHSVHTVFLDGSHQNLCTNRRTGGFVIHKAIPGA